MTISIDRLAVNIRRACNGDDALTDRVLAEVRDSLWLVALEERLEQAESTAERVENLHQRQPIPTRHWVCCEQHIPSPENLRRAGGVIKLEEQRSKCDECSYTEHYHCTYDAHDSCGHDDYPCDTVHAVRGTERATENDGS